MRLYLVVNRHERGEQAIVAAYDDPTLAHALAESVGELQGYQRPLRVRELELNAFAAELRQGFRCYQVVVNPPHGAQVSAAGIVAAPGIRELAPDATWRYRVTLWARDEASAQREAIAQVAARPAAAVRT